MSQDDQSRQSDAAPAEGDPSASEGAEEQPASRAYDYDCPGREKPVAGDAVFPSARQRYAVLPDLVHDIVESCTDLRDINHLDETLLPDSEVVVEIVETAREVMFPGYFGDKSCSTANLAYHIGDRLHSLYLMLSEQIYRSVRHQCRREGAECPHCRQLAEANAQQVLRRIPEIRRMLSLDVNAAMDGDPAARNLDEIILSYPGIYTISVHRLAHELWGLGIPLLPRMISEYAHRQTGIDIHPGAKIGESFFMDHGTGIVVGETSVIGDRVQIYQGVTLGALAPRSFPKDACGRLIRGEKRHPTIEDDVTIYSQATILGGNTVVGARSTIGGNVFLTESVPADSRIMMKRPELVVRTRKRNRDGAGQGTAGGQGSEPDDD